MIDAHCHIDMYEDPRRVMDESERAGILTIGMTNLPSHFEMGYSQFLHYRKVRLALGMHPLLAQSHDQEFPKFIQNINRTSYIGEIGLDFSREGRLTKEIQVRTFQRILTLLAGSRKLLSIHSRKAEKEVLDNLLRSEVSSAIFHWYSGPLKLIKMISDAGYLFSVNPIMVGSKSGQEIIRRIPRNSLLTESDGPFATLKGVPIRPSSVYLVYKHVSKIWNLSERLVEKQISENFSRLLSQIR